MNPVHAAIVVAKEKGFFARAGLDVSFVEPADPSMPPRLVAAGQGDIALTYQPNFYLDVAAGLPIQRIGTSIQTPLNTVMVLADGPIKSLADLKGKTVGYSVAGYETALLGTMLESAGLTLDDVKLDQRQLRPDPAADRRPGRRRGGRLPQCRILRDAVGGASGTTLLPGGAWRAAL